MVIKSNKINKLRKSRVSRKSRVNRRSRVNRKSRRVGKYRKKISKKEGGFYKQGPFNEKLFSINYLTPGQRIKFKTANSNIQQGIVVDVNYGAPSNLIKCNKHNLGNEIKCKKIGLLNIGTKIEYMDQTNNVIKSTILKHGQFSDIRSRNFQKYNNFSSITKPSNKNTPEAIYTLVAPDDNKDVLLVEFNTIVKVMDDPVESGKIKIKVEGEGNEIIYNSKDISIVPNFDLFDESNKDNFTYFKETEDDKADYYFPVTINNFEC